MHPWCHTRVGCQHGYSRATEGERGQPRGRKIIRRPFDVRDPGFGLSGEGWPKYRFSRLIQQTASSECTPRWVYIYSYDIALILTFTQGPDAQSLHHISLPCTHDATSEITNNLLPHLTLAFFASELRLRGNRPVVQPHKQDGDVLCWNGEVRQKFLHCKPVYLNKWQRFLKEWMWDWNHIAIVLRLLRCPFLRSLLKKMMAHACLTSSGIWKQQRRSVISSEP